MRARLAAAALGLTVFGPLPGCSDRRDAVEPEPDPYPNEPSGYVRFAEHTFEALPSADERGACEGAGLLDGCWLSVDPASLHSLAATGSAPSSPPGVFQFRFPTGMPPGYEPGLFLAWAELAESTNTEFRAIYESGWIRVPSPDFEFADLPGVKLLGFLGVATAVQNAFNELYFMSWKPDGAQDLVTATWVTLCHQATLDRCMDPNRVTEPFFTFGQWHHYEAVLVLNDIGSTNGVYRLWWNGMLVADYTDVAYRTAVNPSGFYGRRWGPTWGGLGTRNKSRDDFLQIDHVYLSGIPCDPILECPTPVPNAAPTSRIDSPSQDTTVSLGDAVTFLGTASDSDGTVIAHLWNFNNGDKSEVEDPGPYSYDAPGRYTVTYQVADDDGGVSVQDSVIVTVQLPPPAPNAAPTSRIDNPSQDTTVILGDAVSFLGTGSDSDGTVVYHSWTFGDGNTSSAEDPGSYTYTSAGSYTVAYAVTDDDGATSAPDTVIVTVQERPPPPD